MTSGMRKKGLIAVASFCVLLALLWFVVVDQVVKWVIVSEGSKAVGAKVDVAGADLSLFPAGIEVSGLAVTDPDSPMKNAVAVRRISSDIELRPLIHSKVIINNLRMEGIRLNTPRKTSGALPQSAQAASGKEIALPPWLRQMCTTGQDLQFSIPNVADILAKEQLQALELAKELGGRVDEAKTQWQQRLNELPAQKDFEAYQTRLDKLKTSGSGLAAIMGSATELDSLQSDLRKDLDRLKQAQIGFQKELQDLERQSKQLAKSPLEDVQRLKAKYVLSPEGAANLSRMLFGPKVCAWWQKGYRWYAKLKPYLSSAPEKNGRQGKPPQKVETKERGDALPDFLIREVHLDALLEAGQFTGQAKDITSDPQILGRPVTFKFLGRNLKQVQSVNLNGIIDFIQPDKPNHAVKLLIRQCALQNMDLSDSESLPLSIAKAMADISMDLNLAGPKIDALVKAQLESVQMAVEKAVSSEINAALAEAIKNVTRFGLTAMVTGSNPDYRTKIESDLDKVLQKAVGQIINQAGRKLDSRLRTAITEKTSGPIAEAQNQLGGLDALRGELSNRMKLGDTLLKKFKLPF